jgi:hypothetical protein
LLTGQIDVILKMTNQQAVLVPQAAVVHTPQ